MIFFSPKRYPREYNRRGISAAGPENTGTFCPMTEPPSYEEHESAKRRKLRAAAVLVGNPGTATCVICDGPEGLPCSACQHHFCTACIVKAVTAANDEDDSSEKMFQRCPTCNTDPLVLLGAPTEHLKMLHDMEVVYQRTRVRAMIDADHRRELAAWADEFTRRMYLCPSLAGTRYGEACMRNHFTDSLSFERFCTKRIRHAVDLPPSPHQKTCMLRAKTIRANDALVVPVSAGDMNVMYRTLGDQANGTMERKLREFAALARVVRAFARNLVEASANFERPGNSGRVAEAMAEVLQYVADVAGPYTSKYGAAGPGKIKVLTGEQYAALAKQAEPSIDPAGAAVA